MSLTLTNIPRIMRHHGWNNGARLLEIWFSRPSAVAPRYSAPETSTIKMDRFVLTFSRAREVYNQLVADRIWTNAPAQREIAAMLRRKSLLTNRSQRFGNFSLPVAQLDSDYINYRTVSSSELDDLTASLGSFAFRAVIQGSVSPGALEGETTSRVCRVVQRYSVEIEAVGVYVRDSFDFNGDQHLGYWDDSDNAVSMLNPLSGTRVANEDFRDWRARNGRGGDFVVYSDLKTLRRNPPDRFTI